MASVTRWTARVRGLIDDESVARLRAHLVATIESFDLVALDDRVKQRTAEPFPTLVGTLDAIHLASDMLAREHLEEFRFATHDHELESAARATGFTVLA